RIDVFDAFVELLRRNVDRLDQSSIVEIGCSSGYYAEVLEICGIHDQYYGADYSLHFVDLARKYYPAIPFAVQDATHLGYRDRSFDIVVSGCCLPYVSDFRLAVAEAVRVARRFVLFHRTPVLQKTETLAFVKHAYGVKMPEIHFNEPAMFRTLGAHGLRVVDMAVLTVDWVPQLQDSVAWKSYLCAKEQPLEVGIGTKRREAKRRNARSSTFRCRTSTPRHGGSADQCVSCMTTRTGSTGGPKSRSRRRTSTTITAVSDRPTTPATPAPFGVIGSSCPVLADVQSTWSHPRCC